MRYKNKGKDFPLDLLGKSDLRKRIADTEWSFTRVELQSIIHNEFFNNENTLDGGLVDAAIARLLLLDGVELSAKALYREQERIICGVIQEIIQTGK